MPVIELTTFRLATDADPAAFLAADEAARTRFLYQQPGLLRATTARSAEDDQWVIIVLWGSLEDAVGAAERARADPTVGAVQELVAPDSVHRQRYETFD